MRTTILLAALLLCLPSQRTKAGDFNGDGFADQAIGVPFADIDGQPAGAVHVLYGSGAGLTESDRQLLSPNDFGDSEPASFFGAAIAIGDFDGDGMDDLAVGSPGRAVGDVFGAGVVLEYRGGPSGLALAALWHQDRPGIADKAEQAEQFGISVAAGDFDGDGRADLAVGVFEALKGEPHAGAVHVLYGTPAGLGVARDRLWHQNRAGVKDHAETDDAFGRVLAAGDLDGDGRADLAIGIPGEERQHGSSTTIGATALLYGSKQGLRSQRNALFDAFDLTGAAGSGDVGFGASFAIGNFDGAGASELAIGAPQSSVAGFAEAGAVYVIAHAKKKPELQGAQLLTHDLAGLDGAAADSEYFGFALAAGDFDADGTADLAVGAPTATVEGVGIDQTGAVLVLYGAGSGLSGSGSGLFHQGASGILGAPEEHDAFGAALAAADFDGNGAADLAVGIPGESVGTEALAGALGALYGAPGSGIGAADDQLWYESALTGGDVSTAGELFGAFLGK